VLIVSCSPLMSPGSAACPRCDNIGVLIFGEAGVETAVADDRFVYVGTDTCAADELWRFVIVVRGCDYIHLMMFLRTLR
jgi:Bacteriophage tail sheath protein